ncbi:MAG: XdhC family protein, partial [Desulfobacteraceae bacterium]
MDDLFFQINQELSQGRDIVLATIVGQKGSAPRTTGTRFLIRSDGRFSGTIGGGKLEAEVLQAAPEVFSRRKNRLLFFRLRGEEVAQMEMICGGEVDVFLELISARNPHHRPFFRNLSSLSFPDRRILFATLLEDQGSADQQDTHFLFYSEQEGGYFPPGLDPTLQGPPARFPKQRSTGPGPERPDRKSNNISGNLDPAGHGVSVRSRA